MWVLTSDERHTLYNLSTFDVVVAISGEVVDENERPFAEYRWTVVAQDRHGNGTVQARRRFDQEGSRQHSFGPSPTPSTTANC